MNRLLFVIVELKLFNKAIPPANAGVAIEVPDLNPNLFDDSPLEGIVEII